jgi:hypothetical protein
MSTTRNYISAPKLFSYLLPPFRHLAAVITYKLARNAGRLGISRVHRSQEAETEMTPELRYIFFTHYALNTWSFKHAVSTTGVLQRGKIEGTIEKTVTFSQSLIKYYAITMYVKWRYSSILY